MRHYSLKCFLILLIFLASPAVGTQQDLQFRLLSETQNGVTFLRNPCHTEAFSLIFSFSKDLKDPVQEELVFVALSPEFEDFLRTQHEGMKSVALYARAPQKIGSRQLKVDYIAKMVYEDGSDRDLALPDQIEVVISNDDLAKVLDQSNRSCEAVPAGEREMTLLLSNPSEKCE